MIMSTRNKLMRKITIIMALVLLLAFSPTAFAAGTTLSAGDIVFVGLNADGDDGFSFLLLKDIISGTSVYITDKGWNDGSGFYEETGEGIIKWTADSAFSAGTVVYIRTSENGASSDTSINASKGVATWIDSSNNALTYSGNSDKYPVIAYLGDQVFIYQGTHASPNFIAGIHYNIEVGTTSSTNWDGSATSRMTSALPDTLDNNSAIWVYATTTTENDCFRYNGSTTGTITQLREDICDVANWENQDGTAYDITFSSNPFTITASAPTVTSISPSSGETTGGTSVTITGTDLTGATVVKFGTTDATSYTVNSSTEIVATAPAHAADTVDITVTTSSGTSATSAADRFTYSVPNDAPVATNVQISGTTEYGQTLTGSYDYSDTESDLEGTSTYKWYRSDNNTTGLNKTAITSATSNTYVVQSDDIGKYISFEVKPVAQTGTSPGTIVESGYTSIITKADSSPAIGVTPTLNTKTDTQITLTAVAGYEYMLVADGANISTGTWQDSNIFSSLTASTDYDAYQRVKETTTNNASTESSKLDITTENAPLTGTASISGTATFGEKLTASYTPGNNTGTLSYQWVRGSSDIASANSIDYTLVEADVGEQISVKITSSVESGNVTSAQTTQVAKADCATTTGITPVLSSKTDIQITLTAVTGYEYIVVANGAATSTGTWQDSNILTGLTASTDYDVYQRVKETTTHKASAESVKLDVTTDTASLVGTANITGTLVVGETLSASLSGGNNTGTLSYQWVRENADITGANSSTYFLMSDDIGKKISVKITSSVETGTVTSAQTTAVEKQDCSIPVGVTPVLDTKTSTTIKVKIEVGYEYMVVADGAAYTTGTWQDGNTFTSLSGGTAYDIYQRVKESAAQKPSAVSPKLDVTTNASSTLTGTASISGTTTYGHTLTASLSGTNNTGTLSYQWVRGSTNIASATGSTYVLTASDVGQQIKVKIASSEETGIITSGATAKVVKAASVPAKGIAPVLSTKSRHSVTLTTYSGYEYMVVKNGYSTSTGKWQDSSYFSGLSSGTSYDFYQRKKETSTNYSSSISSKLDIKTYSSSSSSSTATPKPTASPTTTVTLVPTTIATPTDTNTPAPTSTPVAGVKTTVTPQKITEGSKEGTLVVEIKVSDLPEGTKSIRKSDNSVIEITSTDSVFITVDQDDLINGMLEIVTLDEEGVALGSVSMNMSENIDNSDTTPTNKMPLWLKIVLGILVVIIVFTGLYVIGLKRRGY